MDIKSVPQDKSKTYGNMKKTLYAKDGDGKLKSVSSDGWEVEEIATQQALDDIDSQIKLALNEVKEGKKSTLYYHMYAKKMDLLLLSQATGFFRWTVKKDFNPSTFKKIKQSRLLEYCDVLGLNTKEIMEIPSE